ncbi:hypothetical protein MPH_03083 [Macrophomina phaseolina MS6]|uniref:Uncharacterized protein n=1 Tax=Macrophomina phaseolina (strain MS6) TaxID=1126212 RepID=K2RAY5_MACPH|nr:hypothetical protein MPH_03083 [Macrophomina phaseolina MS6]
MTQQREKEGNPTRPKSFCQWRLLFSSQLLHPSVRPSVHFFQSLIFLYGPLDICSCDPCGSSFVFLLSFIVRLKDKVKQASVNRWLIWWHWLGLFFRLRFSRLLRGFCVM